MIERKEYMKQIKPFIDKDIIKIITGIRRCGKSVFLKQIIEYLKSINVPDKNIIYINFEEIEFKNIKTEESLDKLIIEKSKNIEGKLYLFFDEIQKVDGWENSIASYFASFDADIYLTGSVSNLLSQKDSSRLSGRYIEIKMYPFSFKESLEINKSLSEEKVFEEYLKNGGMPFIFTLDEDEEKIEYLKNLYDSIILRDVINQNEVRNIELLDKILQFLIDNVGRTFSSRSISNYFKHEGRNVSSETIMNYLKYCEIAYIIHKVKRENIIGKEILKTQEKYYLTDHGFREVIFRNNQNSESQILENIVFIELLRRGYDVKIGKINDLEIDFICKKRSEKIYIQVSSYLSDEKTIEREFNSLLKIKDQYPKYVLSLNKTDLSYNGIKHKNIMDFLKEEL